MKKYSQIFNLNYFKFKSQMFMAKLKFYFYNFQRKNFKIFKFFDKRKIGSIPRVLISSVVIISFFYIAPIMINYGNENFFNAKPHYWMLFTI